ncbi:MAG: hypothetical protein A3E01_02785 [Gammaproteobacteria bacterium RIFCSPHIGHO2_12_FULL_63_22]|nr:MAG: hypothetical protein A3E01_02785 [Gammaproteobacteria bacterium RIFCSPHIGHO2_12_FULL_63_22]
MKILPQQLESGNQLLVASSMLIPMEDGRMFYDFAQQWERLGNSVPPVMMMAIAEVIKTDILDKAKTNGI